MENTNMWLKYPSTIFNYTEKNESFDSGIIRICYTGKNRNKSSISREAIEKAIPSMYYCPVVCNYSVEEDTIGGHDVDIVKTNNGMRLVNLTDPVGVIPYNCNYYWEIVEDGDKSHEYLCVETILWKRSAAYSKIKRDGIVSQSMEITVKSGKSVDGIYQIDDFIFTAFCLLGDEVEPCFESASLQVFSLQEYKDRFAEMMQEFKNQVTTSNEVDINPINVTNDFSKGGQISLEKIELMKEYGLSEEALDFKLEDFTLEELKEKFEAMKRKQAERDDEDDDEAEDGTSEPSEPETEPEDDPENGDEGTDDGDEPNDDEGSEDGNEEFSLTGEQFLSELIESLSKETYVDPSYGDYEFRRYFYVDYDSSLSEVYCYDAQDSWRLFGFHYSMNGDHVVIDFETKKRKKVSIVDFEEGDADFNFENVVTEYGKYISNSKDNAFSTIKSELEANFNAANQQITSLQGEIEELQQFKNNKLAEERDEELKALFAQFIELEGNELFEALKENCIDMTIEAIESKCFEIKGRSAKKNFSVVASHTVRIPGKTSEVQTETEPYGGVFQKYGHKN